jgi:hypothetical protein
MKVFIINYQDGRKVRVKASWFRHLNYQYEFYRHPKARMGTTPRLAEHYDALIEDEGIESIIAEDMLLSSFEETALLPDIVTGDSESTDFARDSLFSDADKVPLPLRNEIGSYVLSNLLNPGFLRSFIRHPISSRTSSGSLSI